jgi:glycerol uptake operon antiterminator
MQRSIVDMVESQVIASIKSPELIEPAIKSEPNIAFLMTGNILTIKEYIRQLKDGGMSVFIHLDLIEGLSNDRSAIQYLSREWQPDGIITTRSQLIRAANEEGLITIQRVFLIDQGAVNKGIEMIRSCQPNAVEILPGLMPRVIHDITEMTDLPLIAGGLIKKREEIMQALEAGALAISVGNPALWNLGI